LQDLIQRTAEREAQNPIYPPATPSLEPGQKVSGWYGTPDPKKYAAGTNVLSPEQIKEEVAKGNIVMLDDWMGTLQKLEPWQKKLLFESMLADWSANRAFVQLEDGSKISFWDLYTHANHNPEADALLARRRRIKSLDDPVSEDGVAAEGGEDPAQRAIRLALRGGPASGRDKAEEGLWMEFSPEEAQSMKWALVAQGSVWGRRPTRWLRGIDGVCDFNFGMYVHEDAAEQVLGPRYANRDPRQVVADPQYMKDVLAAGPRMGMTFMLMAARDLPLEAVRDTWAKRISQRLHARGVSLDPPMPLPSAEDLDAAAQGSDPSPALTSAITALEHSPVGGYLDLYHMFDSDRLAGQTQLLDDSGTKLREGACLLVGSSPTGSLVVQAMSPGKAHERESYVLGAVHSPDVMGAVLEEFVGESPVDPEFRSLAARNLLVYVNGFKGDNKDDNPHMRRLGEEAGFEVQLLPPRPSLFKLPAVGQQAQPGTTLVSRVSERVASSAVAAAFERAYEAAEAVAEQEGEGLTPEQRARPKFDAAQAVLQRELAALGLNVQGLRLGSGLSGSSSSSSAVPEEAVAAVARKP